MANVDGRGVHLPANEKVWESWVSHVLESKFGSRANAYGRHGQAQDGIDFVVYDGDARVGIQCKFVALGSRLNVAQVAEDIKASQAIVPPITKFLLYTSAPSDAKTTNALDALRPAVVAQGRSFEYAMWRDFEEEVRRYNLFDRLDGTGGDTLASTPTKEALHAVSKPPSEAGVITQDAVTSRASTAATYLVMLDEVKLHMTDGDIAGATALVDLVLKRKDALPDAELARAYGQKAVLVGRAGNAPEAARLWRKAAEAEPSEDLRHGRLAQALVFEGRHEEALAAAIPGLALDPPSTLAALAALISSQHLGRRAEIDARLSRRLKSDRDVGLIRAHMAAVDGQFALAEEALDEVARDNPDDADVMSLQADLLMHEAIGDPKSPRSRLVSGRERRAVEAALSLYRASLDKRDPVREKGGWLPSALNLVTAYKMLDQHEEAADLAARIFDVLGNVDEHFDRLILAMAEGGHEQRALDLSKPKGFGSVMLQLSRASAWMHLGDFGKAEATLAAAESAAEGHEADDLRWMLLAARSKTHPSASLETMARGYYEQAHDKLSACRRIAENARSLGHPELVLQYSRQAIALYQKRAAPDFLLFIADAHLTLGEKEEALRLLLPHVNLDQPQGGLLEERVAFCLLRLHRLESLGKLLLGLDPKASDARRFDAYRIDYQLARGDRSAALSAVHLALARRPAELKLQMMEIVLLRESGQVAEAVSLLDNTAYQSHASLDAVSLYTREARALGRESMADDLAYRWIREHGDVPENAAWFLSYVLLDKKERPVPLGLSAVERQCGVCLKATAGDHQSHWIVIDERFPEDVASGWFTPHSDRISALLGQPRKARIEFNAFPGGPFKIESIVGVLVGAFQLIQRRYGSQLPMVDSLRSFSVKGKGGEYDFSALFKMLDDSKRASDAALSFYADTLIPIGVLAHAMHRHPIDVWAKLVGTHRRVKAMSAGAESAARFSQRLQGSLDIVLDPLALVSWDAFGLLPSALKSTRAISMTVSAVDLIRSKQLILAKNQGKTQTLLGASTQNGFYERTEITPEINAKEIERFDRIMRWVDDHVQVVPAPASGLQEEVYADMRIDWPHYIADGMQLAAFQNRVLVADDIALEALAATSGALQVPTTALFREAAVKGRITAIEHAQVLRAFATANYEFISFNAQDLMTLTDVEATSVTPGVLEMIRYLRIPLLDLPSGLRVMAEYLQRLAECRVAVGVLSAVLVTALSSLSRHATHELRLVYGTFFRFVRRSLPSPYSEQSALAMDAWRKSHLRSLQDVGLRKAPLRLRAEQPKTAWPQRKRGR
ncbi:tetratricopeptide repeat protein [Variovorax sp. PAMC26660]|uniref:tetratricopeptide repeat protein n=1 Tax=Variovorax sp. PAMC26660 TaxID=2762322 RepID=UPI00164ED6F3|nr:hypothetical protein [Variovorax sp. PAMC26660]QNK67610.1 hypothetical protein H7F35_31465 [Variovorax sp. PAMC26660]